MQITVEMDDGKIIKSDKCFISIFSEIEEENIISINNVGAHFMITNILYILSKDEIKEKLKNCNCKICQIFLNELMKFINDVYPMVINNKE